MKKITTLLLALAISATMMGCGGADKQPAIDAYNKASADFNEVADAINANPDAYAQDVFDTMNEMADVLNQHQALLESDEDIDQEKLDQMIEWYGTVEDWVADVKEELDL